MTVAELIKELHRWPLSATVVLDDGETDSEMPVIKVGHGEFGQQRDLKTGNLDNKVHVWGSYD